MGDQPLTSSGKVLAALRAGDRLARCLVTGWYLVDAGRQVADAALAGLALEPLGDGLPGFGEAQTWRLAGER